MTRLRYGPRFRTPLRSVSYHYDERVDRGMIPIQAFMSPEQKFWALTKASATLHNKARGITVATNRPVQPAMIDERAEALDRMQERLRRALDLIVYGIQECIELGCYGGRFNGEAPPHENLTTLIGLAQTIARKAGLPEPEFSMLRKAGQISHRHCLDCNAILAPEDGELCQDCRPDDRAVRAASEQRREQERQLKAKERVARDLRRSIDDLEKKLKP